MQSSGIAVEKSKFYLVNLNADPSMNELLVYYLKVSVLKCFSPFHKNKFSYNTKVLFIGPVSEVSKAKDGFHLTSQRPC